MNKRIALFILVSMGFLIAITRRNSDHALKKSPTDPSATMASPDSTNDEAKLTSVDRNTSVTVSPNQSEFVVALPKPAPSVPKSAEVSSALPSDARTSSKLTSQPKAEPLSGSGSFGVIDPNGNRRCRPFRDGWFMDGDNPGEALTDYTFGVDPNDAGTAFIKSLKVRPRPHAQLNHCLHVDLARGKTLRLELQAKALGVSDYANIHIRSKDASDRILVDEKKAIRGTFEWKNFVLEVEVPEESESIHYGLTVESPGQAWIRNVRLSYPNETSGAR